MDKVRPNLASTRRRQSTDNATADAELAKLGYESKLPRSLGMLSILGLSFAIMAAPYGSSTTLNIAMANGQSVTVVWGWVVVTLISLCIAASLAEICAVYPTAGGVYYWSAQLSTKEYAPIVSWIDGWFNLVGNWTVTLSINFGAAQLILSAITLWREDYVANAWQTVLCFWAVMLFCFLINAFGAAYLDLINKVCIYWTGASVLIILITLLAMSPDLRSGEFVFAEYNASNSGWPNGWAFFVGLLQAAYTLTGYGLVASMCEEVQNPGREVPKAMVLSVAAAGLTGIVYLVPIMFVLPKVTDVLTVANGQPIGFIFKTATGSPGGGFGLLFLIIIIAIFAGIGALTASSRCVYAFARDGAVPGKRWFGETNDKLNIPLWGLVLSTVVDSLLGLIYFGSPTALYSFTGVATICLSWAYGVPILVSMVRGRNKVKHSTFSLGKFGYLINGICVVWIVMALFIFSMPYSIPPTLPSMNYASVVFAGFGLISVIWYLIRGRKDFKGPPVAADEDTAITGQFLQDNEKALQAESSAEGSPKRS